MNFSDVGSKDPRFSNSNKFNSNPSFDFPMFRGSVSEKAALGSSTGLAKPRLCKTRKQAGTRHPRSMPARESGRSDSGINPCRPVFEGINPALVGLKLGGAVSGEFGKGENETFVFGANRSGSRLSVMDSVREQEVVSEMSKLGISSGRGLDTKEGTASNLNTEIGAGLGNAGGRDRADGVFRSESHKTSSFDEIVVSNLPVEMEKLNIEGSGDNKGLKNAKSGGSEDSAVGISLESELPNELKRLNIRSSKDHGSDDMASNADTREAFVFGSKLKGEASASERLVGSLSAQIKNLNIKGSSGSNDDDGSIGCFSGRTENIVLNEMNKLRVRSEAGDSVGGGGIFPAQESMKEVVPKNLGGKQSDNIGKSNSTDFTSDAGLSTKDQIGRGLPIGTATKLNVDGFGLPSQDRPQQRCEFIFSSRQDDSKPENVEFRTPKLKMSGLNHFVELNAKREASKDARSKPKRGKLRQVNPVPMQPEKEFIQMESKSESNIECSESYSPMDISPYQETLAEAPSSAETSVSSDESFCFHKINALTNPSSVPRQTIDEDLVAAMKCSDIDGTSEANCNETKEAGSESVSGTNGFTEGTVEELLSAAETESFKSADENLDDNSDATSTSGEIDSGSVSKNERQYFDGRTQFSFASCPEDSGRPNFTFAACASSTQGQYSAAMRLCKTKSRKKAGLGSRTSAFDADAMQAFPSSGVSSLLSQSKGLKFDVSSAQFRGENKAEVDEKEVLQQRMLSASAAVQEACEKWRLRGNQAYANGDLCKAEDYYTQGIGCVSQTERSESCLRALMLCYSNRAATRMSLGRMREALVDCLKAAPIDPNFVRVQVRAANCYLALGEVEDAARCFKKCLRSGSEACVDPKMAVEASEGLLKAQKVSNAMACSAELLQHRTFNDAESALDVVSDALSVSMYSEKLLKIKAEALIMLQKYEEVIQLCNQTLGSAEKNTTLRCADGNSLNTDDSESLKHPSFRLWRLCLSFKSYFCLGRLEDALDLVERQEGSDLEKIECKALETEIPLIPTVHELLRHKALGNESFQSGKFSDAVEHYTAALTCNADSRPFAAVCFCNRAAAYKALGQITEAIADCSLAIALDGNYIKALSRRATLFEMIRDYEQASTDLQKLLSVLTKQSEEKSNHPGASGKSASVIDPRQVQLHLLTLEEKTRKEIPLDLYLILGVEPFVSATEIRKAYRKAALRHHPDKAGQYLARGDNGDNSIWKQIAVEFRKDADRLFKMIGEAYAILSDPTKRSRYDLEEETRNGQSKENASNPSRMQTDFPNYPFNQSNNRRDWREIKRSYWNSHNQGSDASQSNKNH